MNAIVTFAGSEKNPMKKATKKKKKSKKDVNVVIMCSHVASASVVMYL